VLSVVVVVIVIVCLGIGEVVLGVCSGKAGRRIVLGAGACDAYKVVPVASSASSSSCRSST
jgi:hypothetical protein